MWIHTKDLHDISFFVRFKRRFGHWVLVHLVNFCLKSHNISLLNLLERHFIDLWLKISDFEFSFPFISCYSLKKFDFSSTPLVTFWFPTFLFKHIFLLGRCLKIILTLKTWIKVNFFCLILHIHPLSLNFNRKMAYELKFKYSINYDFISLAF